MNYSSSVLSLAVTAFVAFSFPAVADTARDCVLQGTLKKHAKDSEAVYVAFHSARPAEEGANCRIRRNEKLHFLAPEEDRLEAAEPGTRVEYRFTEDGEGGSTWRLRNISS